APPGSPGSLPGPSPGAAVDPAPPGGGGTSPPWRRPRAGRPWRSPLTVLPRVVARLTVQEAARVAEELVGADGAVAVLLHEAGAHLVQLLHLFRVGGLGGGGDPDDVLQVREEFPLDGLPQPLVGGVVEPAAPPGVAGHPDQDLFPEALLGVFGDADLLLDGAHQLLVGVDLLAGDGVLHLLGVAV